MYDEAIKIPFDKLGPFEKIIYNIIISINKNNCLKNIEPNTITIFRFLLLSLFFMRNFA